MACLTGITKTALFYADQAQPLINNKGCLTMKEVGVLYFRAVGQCNADAGQIDAQCLGVVSLALPLRQLCVPHQAVGT